MARRSSLERYLGRGERVILQTREHPFAIFASFLRALGTIVPLVLVLWGLSGFHALDGTVGHWIRAAIVLCMLAAVVQLAWRVLEWELAVLYITSEKVVYVRGVVNRQIASTALVKVTELTVSQPLMGRLFDYGSFVVDTPGADTAAPLHGLRDLPSPAAIYRIVGETARRERAAEGGGHIDVTVGDDDPDDGDTTVIRRP